MTRLEPSETNTTEMKHETEQEEHVARRDGVCPAYAVALETIKF